jgi:hypothetical protein
LLLPYIYIYIYIWNKEIIIIIIIAAPRGSVQQPQQCHPDAALQTALPDARLPILPGEMTWHFLSVITILTT